MDDKTVQRKLNQLAKITNELRDEAERRYGPEGTMFYEAGGSFCFMKHDRDGDGVGPNHRIDGVVMSSGIHCRMDCGGW